MTTDLPKEQKPSSEYFILSALLGQVNETTDHLIDTHKEDALFWKERYSQLAHKLLKYTQGGSMNDFMELVDEAHYYGSLAQDEINRSESIA